MVGAMGASDGTSWSTRTRGGVSSSENRQVDPYMQVDWAWNAHGVEKRKAEYARNLEGGRVGTEQLE